MGRKNYALTEATYAKFAREGRGAGEGADYLPWIRVDEVPSRGRSHRVWCHLTGRAHHFLSDTEFLAFHKFWWDEAVEDVREQFPLVRAVTLDIARRLGVRHPTNAAGTPIVRTTDLLLTRRDGDRHTLEAYAVKTSTDLSERSLAKLDIERLYWLERGTRWGLVLDVDVKTTTVRNIAWSRGALLPRMPDPRPAGEALLRFLAREGSSPANVACLAFDRAHRLEPGSSLSLLRLLIGTRLVETDMSHRSIQRRPAEAFAWRTRAVPPRSPSGAPHWIAG